MQTKDVREKILNFMREESYAPMTSEELVDALGHDVNPNKFWDELLALEQNGEIIKTYHRDRLKVLEERRASPTRKNTKDEGDAADDEQ